MDRHKVVVMVDYDAGWIRLRLCDVCAQSISASRESLATMWHVAFGGVAGREFRLLVSG
jgi:hypothetical protein